MIHVSNTGVGSILNLFLPSPPGCLGALPLALLVSFFAGVFTCLFMFYDSNVPGNFPPTPVSPRNRLVGRDNTGWHLGYIFVPVNTLAAFTLALFCLRVNMGLPLFWAHTTFLEKSLLSLSAHSIANDHSIATMHTPGLITVALWGPSLFKKAFFVILFLGIPFNVHV